MIRSSFHVIRKTAMCFVRTIRAFSVDTTELANNFNRYLLESIVNEKSRNLYTTLVSATSDSLMDGYLQTINKETDLLVIVSNGFDGDEIAKRAVSMGIPTQWSYLPSIYPMDADEAAQSIIFNRRTTHTIFTHVESFTGGLTPLRQIISHIRHIRKDVSICVDDRNGYMLHPMPQLDDVIDYSLHDTSILGIDPSFGFMVAHTPAILAEATQHPQSILGSICKKDMCLKKMMSKVQSSYCNVLCDKSYGNMMYTYEDTKSQIVNKVKMLLPSIPRGMEQSCYSVSFIVPQENARLRELLESLKEMNIPVDYRFITTSVPAISFNIGKIIKYLDNGGEINDIYKCIQRVTRIPTSTFYHDEKFLKDEERYRKKYIYGDTESQVSVK